MASAGMFFLARLSLIISSKTHPRMFPWNSEEERMLEEREWVVPQRLVAHLMENVYIAI